jgi:hypothetical protein
MNQAELLLSECLRENDTLNYACGRISSTQKEAIETHLILCETCRKTLADLAHTLANPDLIEEMDMVTAQQTMEAAYQLVADVKPLAKRSIFSSYRVRLALAASFLIVLLVSVLWVVSRTQNSNDLTSGLALFQRATAEIRPCEYRITGLDYAPFRLRRSGMVTLDNKDLSVAQRHFAKATAQPFPVVANHNLGKVLIAMKEYDQAIVQLKTTLRTEPNNLEIMNDLAIALVLNNDAPAALHYLDDALQRNPNDLTILFNRALLLETMGRIDEARSSWDTYLSLDATSPWAAEVRDKKASLH